MERYLLQRADGAFFRHPTDDDLSEWSTSVEAAHRWVDHGAAAAAAYIWNTLKGEDVTVVPATFTTTGFEIAVRRR
jgi:hypothetical protein